LAWRRFERYSTTYLHIKIRARIHNKHNLNPLGKHHENNKITLPPTHTTTTTTTTHYSINYNHFPSANDSKQIIIPSRLQ